MVTLGRVARRTSILVVSVLALVSVPTDRAQGQFLGGWMGYPGYGYGFRAYGASYGFPVVGYGYGHTAPAFVNVYPSFGYGYAGYGYGVMPAYGMPYGAYGYGYGYPFAYSGLANPLFGVGMTPLGVQSYLYERNVLGRGMIYSSGYAGYRYAPGAIIGNVVP